MADYVTWSITHLGALALILISAAGMGNLFARKFRFHNLVERLVFTVTLGLGLCAIVLFILGLLGILYKSLVWILTVAGSTATLWAILSLIRKPRGKVTRKRLSSIERWKLFCRPRNMATLLLILLALACASLLLVRCQYPPTNWDSISNHLVVARANLTAHRLVVVPGIPQPVLPLLNHMLFTWALALQDDILAQMIVDTFLMLTALGLYAWGKRHNRAAVGCAAAALWLAHPLIRELGKTAYVDIGLTCFVFLGVYALGVLWENENRSWWYLGITLLAMAAGTKMTGLFFVAAGTLLGLVVLAVPLLTYRKRGGEHNHIDVLAQRDRLTWKSLGLGWTLALLIVIPWYGFDSYLMGNPLWPLFTHINQTASGNPLLSMSNGVLDVFSGLRVATVRRFLMVSVDFLRDPERFNAENNLTLFPMIAIWPLAWVIALFRRSLRWWVIWALGFTVFWFLTIPLIRYWLPVVPMAGLALCEAIQCILEAIRRSTVVHHAVWVTAAVVILSWTSWHIWKETDVMGLPPVAPETREDFLSQLNGYIGLEYINAHAETTDTVCVLGAPWLNYYFHQRVLDEFGKPKFHWPDDQLWIRWLDSRDVKWIFIYLRDPELSVPNQNPIKKPFWPDYQIVFANQATWVFHHKAASDGSGVRNSSMLATQ